MPINCYEHHDSRGFAIDVNSRSLTRRFFVTGTMSEADVEATVVAQTPVSVGPLARKSVRCDPVGGGHWFADVEYGTIDPNEAIGATPGDPAAPGPDDALDSSYSMETTAQTVHITRAIATKLRQTGTGNNGPDPSLAIGLTKDRVEGCDIYAGTFTFSRTVPRFSVNMKYINAALYGLVGRVNDARFYTFAPGEVLYLGCTGTFTQQDRWKLTHKFACQPNEVDVEIGNDPQGRPIKLPAKAGWDYVWVRYAEAKVGNQVLPVPEVAYVQQVYKSGNFALLGIGVDA